MCVNLLFIYLFFWLTGKKRTERWQLLWEHPWRCRDRRRKERYQREHLPNTAERRGWSRANQRSRIPHTGTEIPNQQTNLKVKKLIQVWAGNNEQVTHATASSPLCHSEDDDEPWSWPRWLPSTWSSCSHTHVIAHPEKCEVLIRNHAVPKLIWIDLFVLVYIVRPQSKTNPCGSNSSPRTFKRGWIPSPLKDTHDARH